LASIIKARWVCEQAHQQLKEVLGLDHFEGRSWRGLHRHALMSLIAFCFLQHQRLQAAKWGEKVERTAAPAEPASDQASLSSALRRCDGPTMSHLPSPVPPQLAT
jgi:SRSO17 transposase